jgi:hypothetical protein
LAGVPGVEVRVLGEYCGWGIYELSNVSVEDVTALQLVGAMRTLVKLPDTCAFEHYSTSASTCIRCGTLRVAARGIYRGQGVYEIWILPEDLVALQLAGVTVLPTPASQYGDRHSW